MMKDGCSPESNCEPSPQRFPSYEKEDSEDRLATRNSLQMTTEEECIEGRRSKRRKLQVMLHSQRQNKATATTSIPILEEIEPTKTILPATLNQNQRISFQKQPIKHDGSKAGIKNNTKRNKIFSQTYLHKRYSLELADGPDKILDDISSTKRLSAKLQSVNHRLDSNSERQDGSKKEKHRWILHEINSNAREDFPTVIKDRSESNKPETASNVLLSHPQFAPLRSNQTPLSRGPTQSHIFRCSSGKTHRIIFATEQGEKHANPAAKKIKHVKTKAKTSQSSFSKLTLERYHPEHHIFEEESRASHCLLPECLIKDNFTNYNIKLVESCSSEEEEGERYFDTEESPIKQKISYRNIDILQSNVDDAVQQDETRHHNLFSDFECPASPKREQHHRSSIDLMILKSTRKVIAEMDQKRPFHLYLIGVALLLLIVQMVA